VLGYLTPGLIDLDSAGDPNRAGRAYAINIVGCILGPLLASYVFLPYIGVKNAMILMALPLCDPDVRSGAGSARSLKVLAGCVSAVLLVCAVFVNRSYEEAYDRGIVRRDATATVISLGEGMGRRLLVNGVGITETHDHHQSHGTHSAGDPAQAEKCPDDLFRDGDDLSLAAHLAGVKVTAVELVPSVKDAFGY
jgi:hypothetical protein